MFTHVKKAHNGVPLVHSYADLREAVLELFLSVKIRDDNEIDAYNEDLFKIEKSELKAMTGFELVDMVKEAIEKLMNMEGAGGGTEEEEETEESEMTQDLLSDKHLQDFDKAVDKHFAPPKLQEGMTDSMRDLEKKLNGVKTP